MEIRKAQRGDESAIIDLIIELAVFEKEPDAVKNTPEKLASDLFNSRYCEALVVEDNNLIVGYAIYYMSYSTWNGPCLYLEDIYITDSYRNAGIGGQLFKKVVDIAKARKVRRMDWQVLKWNEGAIRFYERVGATLDSEWLNGRMFFDN